MHSSSSRLFVRPLDPARGSVSWLGVAGILVTLAGFLVTASWGDSLVIGGAFDSPSDVLAWDPGFDDREVNWDPADTNQNPASGSLRLTDEKLLANGGLLSVSQCFPVTQGLLYRFSARALIPAGQNRTTSSELRVWFSATGDCDTASVLLELNSNTVVTTGSWESLSVEDTVAPEFAHSAVVFLGSKKSQDGGSVDVHFDDVVVEELTGDCVSTFDTLCLTDNRFAVQVEWLAPNGDQGTGAAVDATSDSGLFWFFDAANLEMLIKVLDTCSFSPFYWVYFAATTDVSYRVTVTDTETGGLVQYINPQGVRAQATTDNRAFPCN